MGSQSLRMSAKARALFDSAKLMGRIEGRVASNVDYMPYLDKDPGHSTQAPNGIIAPHLAEFQAIAEAELREGLKQYPDDPQKAAEAGVTMATLGIMRQIADYTPVDTGRAKVSWTAYLPGGRSPIKSGSPMTAEQQKARRVAQHAADKVKAAKTGTTAAKIWTARTAARAKAKTKAKK